MRHLRLHLDVNTALMCNPIFIVFGKQIFFRETISVVVWKDKKTVCKGLILQRLTQNNWETRIVDRQCSLLTSSKSTCTPWFISFTTNARWGWSAEWRARYRHVCKTTFGHLQRNSKEKTYEKTTLFVIHYGLIIFALSVMWDVQGFSKSLDGQMPVFLDNSGDGIDVGCHQNCSWHTTLPRGSNSAYSNSSTKALCQRRIVESPNISFPNTSCNNVVVSAVDFFPINRSSIKSEPRKSIFFDFWNFWSCLIDQAMIEKLIFFQIVFVNYARIDVYFCKNRRLFLYKMFFKINFKLA